MTAAVGLFVVAAVVLVAGLVTPLRGLVLSGLLVAGAAVVFVLVVTDESLDAADLPVLSWLVAHRSPGATTAAETISLVGGTVPTFGLAVVAAVVLALRGRRRTALVWVLGVLLGAATIRLLKVAVERARPPVATRVTVETSASLPSGHSLMAALGISLAAAAVWRLVRAAGVRAVAVVAAAAAVLAIGVSRAYLGVHWTTDVLAGWLLGAAIASACVTFARRYDATPPTPRPIAAPARR